MRAQNDEFSFSRQKAVGAQGEVAVRAWLERAGYTVDDVSADAAERKRDVDCYIEKDGVRLAAEIKTDSHAPDNLFVELTVDDKPGYLYKSRADILLYYFPGAHTLLWLPLASLAWWVHEHASDLKRIRIKSTRGKRSWYSEGIVVPVAGLVEAGLVVEYDLSMVYGKTA
jgi:hypothetical protein